MTGDEEVLIKRDKFVKKKQEYLEPDEDLRNAITMDEFLEKVLEDIDKFYANKQLKQQNKSEKKET